MTLQNWPNCQRICVSSPQYSIGTCHLGSRATTRMRIRTRSNRLQHWLQLFLEVRPREASRLVSAVVYAFTLTYKIRIVPSFLHPSLSRGATLTVTVSFSWSSKGSKFYHLPRNRNLFPYSLAVVDFYATA